MNNQAICKKISSMLSLYIDNRLTEQDKAFVESHLNTCAVCKKKYLYLKSLIKNLKDSYRQIVELSEKKHKQKTFSIREHQFFLENISPYIDNELDTQKSYEFRKYLLKSKQAQKELKNLYSVQRLLRNAYNSTRNNTVLTISDKVIRPFRKSDFNFFDSVILEQLFSMKTVKIAILAGVVMFTTYGAFTLDTPVKRPAKQVLEVVLDKLYSSVFSGG